MSEEYKDYLAVCILIIAFGGFFIFMLWATGWLFLVIMGIIGIMGLFAWALDRVAAF